MALQVGSATAVADSTSTRTTNKDLGQKDIFLKLLVAQMKNQDPLKPQDATQMSSQLAQFNMVEQQTNTNQWLEQMASNGGGLGAVASSGLDTASAGYLGRTVTVNQNTVQYNGGNPIFSTDLPVNATSVQVVVRDSAGKAIRTIDMGAMPQGLNTMSWDGLNDTGAASPLGTYTLDMTAVDAQGTNITAKIQRSGLVDAVRLASGGVQLMVGGIPVNLQDVTAVKL
ncbi:MAG: flagellar hook capping FlgD N-terminal domain-containing protein [Mariprofundaceae bacterium]|nr:flagellar hook capping FlgD N-terminal domain-containing protein [Mariprofundaceae bacterium]